MTSAVRHAVITGATGGVGKAVAERIAGLGYGVVLLGRDAGRLAQVAERLRERNDVPVASVTADFSDRRSVSSAAEKIARACPAVDLLVHAAGALRHVSVGDTSPEHLDAMLAVNASAPFELTRALLPRLTKRSADVVFLNSSAVQSSNPDLAAYTASKHALRGLTDALRADLNARGVRVLSIYPGRTASAMQAELFRVEGRRYRPELLLQPESIAELIACAVSLPHSAEVTEIFVRPARKS